MHISSIYSPACVNCIEKEIKGKQVEGAILRFVNISSLITLLTSFLGNSDSSIVPPCVCFNKKNSGWQALQRCRGAKSVFTQYPWLILTNYKSSLFSLCLIYPTFSLVSPCSLPLLPNHVFLTVPRDSRLLLSETPFSGSCSPAGSGGCGECD